VGIVLGAFALIGSVLWWRSRSLRFGGPDSKEEKLLIEEEEEGEQPERVVLNAEIVEDDYHRGRTEVLGVDGTVVASFEPLVRLSAKNAACICDGIREQAGIMHFVVIDGSSGREVAAS
jgi:nitrogen fixation-related uncharacterized protein